MLDSGYMEVLQARTSEELSRVVRFSLRLEFETVSAALIIDPPAAPTEVFCVDNAPEAYRYIFDDSERGATGPVTQHCKNKNLPIVWGQATYAAEGQGAEWEEMAMYGYCHGVCMALYLPHGRYFCSALSEISACRTTLPRSCRWSLTCNS